MSLALRRPCVFCVLRGVTFPPALFGRRRKPVVTGGAEPVAASRAKRSVSCRTHDRTFPLLKCAAMQCCLRQRSGDERAPGGRLNHPGFPGRFEDITAATAFCRSFFPWYNTEHRHGGIAMLTPNDVHHHRAPQVLAQRERTLQAVWTLLPERFVHGTPKPGPLPEAVWTNPPVTSTTGETTQ